jgi:nucleoside-diphosphate-sugar epimerase
MVGGRGFARPVDRDEETEDTVTTRYLVTGGSGFIGTNVVQSLVEAGHEVLSLDVEPPRDARHTSVWQGVNICDLSGLRTAFEGFQPQVVLHLAARTDLDGTSVAHYAANTEGVRNVIRAASQLPRHPHTVYASSRLIFDIDHKPASTFDYAPSTAYGESKVRSEEIVRDEASRAGTWTIVRPTSIWGPWFRVPYRTFFDQVRAGRYVNTPGNSPRKSYGYVGNSVHQLSVFCDRAGELDREVLWLTDYPPLELRGWANLIARELGRRPPREVPAGVLRVAARVGDVAKRLGYASPPLTSFRLHNLNVDMVYDTSATERLVGELPFTLEEGVRRTVAWMREHG